MSYDRLFSRLEEIGWTPRDGMLVAPNGTMWLDTTTPWPSDLSQLQKDMSSRHERIETFAETDPDTVRPALDDVSQVLDALREILNASIPPTGA